MGTHKYLLGICYTCQKCLHCFQSSQQDSCKCKKSKQPLRTKKPKRGQQIYQRVFTPNPLFPKANKFLLDANIKFDYNSNFEEKFSYTFCSACNSKIQRLRNNDKIDKITQQVQENDNEVNASDISLNEKEADNHDADQENSDKKEYVDIEEEKEDSSDDNDLEEIKVQIIVKSKNIKEPTAKILTITPVNYENIMGKINSEVQKVLKKKDYTISYKAVNARGPSNTLEDWSDFQEFIGEYQKVFLSGKKMLVVVVVKDKEKLAKKHKKVKNILFIYIL